MSSSAQQHTEAHGSLGRAHPLTPGCTCHTHTGDLNAPPDEAAHTIVEQHGSQSAHRVAHGQEPPVTWPSGLQAPLMDEGEPHCADYVYVRGGQGCGLEVVAAQLVGQEPHPEDKTLYPSDHVGLKVMVRVGATG